MYPRSSPRHLLRLVGVTLLLLMAGCAHYPINPPIDSLPNPDDYRFNTFAGSHAENIDENFIIVSFSGGGWRATSLAYGFLKELEKQKVEEGKTLLDDVNVISSVSGGSFTSAYYVLFGKEKFFRDFKKGSYIFPAKKSLGSQAPLTLGMAFSLVKILLNKRKMGAAAHIRRIHHKKRPFSREIRKGMVFEKIFIIVVGGTITLGEGW